MKPECKEAFSNLNERQKKFVMAYVRDPSSATRAALYAGYSKKSAHGQAHYLLKRPKIVQAISEFGSQVCDEASRDLKKELKIDAARVLLNAQLVFDMAIEGLPVFDRFGNIIGRRPDLSAANKAIELMGRHIDVGAWLEKRDVTSKGEKLEGDSKTYILRVNGQDIEFK